MLHYIVELNLFNVNDDETFTQLKVAQATLQRYFAMIGRLQQCIVDVNCWFMSFFFENKKNELSGISQNLYFFSETDVLNCYQKPLIYRCQFSPEIALIGFDSGRM